MENALAQYNRWKEQYNDDLLNCLDVFGNMKRTELGELAGGHEKVITTNPSQTVTFETDFDNAWNIAEANLRAWGVFTPIVLA